MTTQTGNAAVVESIVAAMQAGDIEGILARFHPEIEIHEADSLPFGGVFRGHAGFQDLLRRLLGPAELSIDTATIREADDAVFILMDVSLTSRSTGRTLKTQVLEMERFQDGLVRRIDVFYKDTQAVTEFLVQP